MTRLIKFRDRFATVALACVMAGCASTQSLVREDPGAASQVIDAPAQIVFQAAQDAASDVGLLVVSADPASLEIRLNSGSYTTNMFLCSGNLLGVFLTDIGQGKTRLNIVEKKVLATQVLGCQDKASLYVARLKSRLAAQPSRSTPSSASLGTGFVVTLDGLLVTSFHVIEGSAMVSAKCGRQDWATVEVVKTDQANDLAVLRLPNYKGDALPLGRAGNLHAGDRVYTLGFPAPELLGVEPKFTDGVVSALSGPSGAYSMMQITIPVQPGNSGGPVVSENGDVVGVVASTASVDAFLRHTGSLPQNVNWAVKAEYVDLLLEESRRPPQQTNTRGQTVDRVKASLCLIRASRS